MNRSLSPNHRHNMAGMTLLEVLVAMGIGLFLMAGVLQVFVTGKNTYAINEGRSRMQENARFALNYMTSRLRVADGYGCGRYFSPPLSTQTFTNTLGTLGVCDEKAFCTGVEGYEAVGTGINQTYQITATNPAASPIATNWTQGANTLPALLRTIVFMGFTGVYALVIPGTDVLLIRGATGDEMPLTATVPSPIAGQATTISACATIASGGLSAGDFVAVSDCSHAMTFQVATVVAAASIAGCAYPITITTTSVAAASVCGPTPPSSVTAFGATTPSNASLYKVITESFYVGVGGDGSPALFHKVGTASSEELVSGVESMQILYGEDSLPHTPMVATRYVTATTPPNWANVTSLRISLLLRTFAQVRSTTDTNTYLLGGATAATAVAIKPVADKRLRQVFNATVSLRNRGNR